MSAAAEAVETSLREVDRARGRVSRHASKQIAKADDRDYLKSVAYSWFKSHRPVIAASVPETALEAVDAKLKEVLDATARSSARTTYLTTLKEAKDALATLRGLSLLPSGASPSASDPSESSPAE